MDQCQSYKSNTVILYPKVKAAVADLVGAAHGGPSPGALSYRRRGRLAAARDRGSVGDRVAVSVLVGCGVALLDAVRRDTDWTASIVVLLV